MPGQQIDWNSSIGSRVNWITSGLPTTLAEGTSRIAVQVTQDLAAASQ